MELQQNKRGITLDLAQKEGVAILLRLAERADILIESELPGTLAAIGLGYDALAKVNPRLAYVSITPFGQDGPKASYADADLVILAAGGPLAVTGDDDRPPLRITAPSVLARRRRGRRRGLDCASRAASFGARPAR